MGQATRRLGQRCERVVRPDITVDDHEGILAQQRQRLEDATPGFERRGRFRRVAYMHPVGSAVAEVVHEHLAEMGMVDHDIAQAGSPECVDEVKDQWAITDLQQRLRARVSQRTQPLATPGCQNHRLHVTSEGVPMEVSLRSRKRACKGCKSAWRALTSSRYPSVRGISSR